MKRKFVAVQPAYMMLSANMLAEDLKELLEAQIKTLGTGIDAARFAAVQTDWSYTTIGADPIYCGHVGILCYKGADVALFYKRQFLKVQPDQDGIRNAAPVNALRKEEDAWMRLSLLETKSALKQSQFYSSDFDKLKETNRQQEGMIRSQRLELEAQAEELDNARKELEELREKKGTGVLAKKG